MGGREIPLGPVKPHDLVSTGCRPVIEGHPESLVGEVAGQVRAHHRHPDYSDLGQLLAHVSP